MKKSELKEAIKKTLLKEQVIDTVTPNMGSDIPQGIGQELAYEFKNDEDVTLAGMIDGWVIDNIFDGDYDKFEYENGHERRDAILEKLLKSFYSNLISSLNQEFNK